MQCANMIAVTFGFGRNLLGYFTRNGNIVCGLRGDGGRKGLVLCLDVFYFWALLLEDYCMWQGIHYLDCSSGVGEHGFINHLSMTCAAIVDRKA